MKITIVHVYHDGLCEHYVGAVLGKVKKSERKAFAAKWPHTEDEDISFVEVEVKGSLPTKLLNIDGNATEVWSK